MQGKKAAAVFLMGLFVASQWTVGCSPEKAAVNIEESLSGTLTFAIWDNNLNDYIINNNMVEKFQEVYPNVDIEIEKIKDDTEYWDTMEMRASANQLPDIMFNKTFTLARFQDYLIDLTDTEAAKNNELAEGYGVNGKILGIPQTKGYEYIYYWKDLFEEAGAEIPDTWKEFKQVSLTLQEYYEKKDTDFSALAMGLKDSWCDYPFMEFMPCLVSGNGDNWNRMASQDTPFTEGTDIYTAYQKVYDLFSSGVLGKNALDTSSDQATASFAEKKSAMIALGDWGLLNIQNDTDDVSDLGTFYLPVREKEADPFYVIVQGDSFMGVTTHSKNQEAAIAFVEWFFSDSWYPEYIEYITAESAMVNYPKEKNPILAEADKLCQDKKEVLYDGGGDAFTVIQNYIAFDYKELGAKMMTAEFDLHTVFGELNGKWSAAREKLNVN